VLVALRNGTPLTRVTGSLPWGRFLA
jgi:hypothetical protein